MKPLFPTYIIKKQAKNAMRGRFWTAFAVTVIPSLLISVIAAIVLYLVPQTRDSLSVMMKSVLDATAASEEYIEAASSNVLLTVEVLTALFAFLNVGSIKACLDMLRGKEVKVKNIFCFYSKWYIAILYPAVFSALSYLCTAVVKSLLNAGVELALVTVVAAAFDLAIYLVSFKLLFIDYALADNNCENVFVAIKSAWKMTGFNTVMNAILLGLSFIGWVILGAFTMGLVFIYVAPYFSLSVAALYEANVQFNKAE